MQLDHKADFDLDNALELAEKKSEENALPGSLTAAAMPTIIKLDEHFNMTKWHFYWIFHGCHMYVPVEVFILWRCYAQ